MAATYTCSASLNRSARSPGPSVTRCRAGAVVTRSSHHGATPYAASGDPVVVVFGGPASDLTSWRGRGLLDGSNKSSIRGSPGAGGGSVGAGGPPERGTARRGGSTHVNEAGGAR